MVNLNKHNGNLKQEMVVVEKKITEAKEEIETMVASKTISTNRAVIVQTIAVILTLIGLALAAEHRVTVVETEQKVNRVAQSEINKQTAEMLKDLQQGQLKSLEREFRNLGVLDGIEKRHQAEDIARLKR